MKRVSLSFIFCFLALVVNGQDARKKVEAGNQAFAEGAFDKAEINYREALKKAEKHTDILNFNLGDALHKQERFEEAQKAFELSLTEAKTKAEKAAAYHNLANNYLKQEKLKEAIQNYKQALINNPSDEQTRYNLAKALEQQKQQQQQQKQDQKDQDKKDQDKKDQEEQKQDQENQDENQDQNKDQKQDQDQSKDQQDSKKDEQSSAEQQQKEMNRQNAERLLQALDRDEEKLQKELLKKKIKAKPLKSLKDW